MNLSEIPAESRTVPNMLLYIARCAEVAALTARRPKVAKYAALKARGYYVDEKKLERARVEAQRDCEIADQYRLYSQYRGAGAANYNAQKLAFFAINNASGWGAVELATRHLVATIYEDGWSRTAGELSSTNDRGPLFAEKMKKVQVKIDDTLSNLIAECFFDAARPEVTPFVWKEIK